MRQRLAEIGVAFRGVVGHPDLRRIQLSWAASMAGAWSYSVVLVIYAFRAGGAAVLGALIVIRMLPLAIIGPFAGMLGDRYRREMVILVADLVRVALLGGAAAAAAAGASSAVVLVLATVAAFAGPASSAARGGLLPTLARNPQELAAVNLSFSTLENAAQFVIPAAAGLLVAATSPSVVFAVTAVCFLGSALFVSRIRTAPPVRTSAIEHPTVLREASAGFRTIIGHERLRSLVALLAVQALVAGAMSVLVVVAAFDVLGLGEAGVGLLTSSAGVGGLVGSGAALALIGGRRMARYLGVGLALFGAPLVAVGLWPDAALALVLIGIGGGATTIVEVAGSTVLQRIVPDEVRARVFSALESIAVGTTSVGALLAPILTSVIGIREALVVTGSVLPLAVALGWRSLGRLDEVITVPTRELELLAGVPMFAPLGPLALEQLAAELEPVRAGDGEELVRKGDAGDRFYIVADGQVEVVLDGRTSLLGPGEFFGEIALLRDVPRTATVRARGVVELYALGRDDFLTAITPHRVAVQAAEAVVAGRLGFGHGAE